VHAIDNFKREINMTTPFSTQELDPKRTKNRRWRRRRRWVRRIPRDMLRSQWCQICWQQLIRLRHD